MSSTKVHDISVHTLQGVPEANTKEIMQDVWPTFMSQDKYSMRYWVEMKRKYPEYQLCLFEGQKLVGVGNTIPICWSGEEQTLPSSWTDTLIQGVENKQLEAANTLAGVNIAIHRDYQKAGLSTRLLQEFKALAKQKGFSHLVVPVRPSFKADYPLASFDRYIHWKREDGAPFDPWIRTHWRLGATIIKPIPRAMTVKMSIREWETTTNLRFLESGEYIVKGALVPVYINCEEDYGIYHDPNVWMVYEL